MLPESLQKLRVSQQVALVVLGVWGLVTLAHFLTVGGRGAGLAHRLEAQPLGGRSILSEGLVVEEGEELEEEGEEEEGEYEEEEEVEEVGEYEEWWQEQLERRIQVTIAVDMVSVMKILTEMSTMTTM